MDINQYGKTKTEAQVKKATLLEEAKGWTTYIDGDKVTVKDWLDKWLVTYAKPKVRQNTYESYESVARIHVIPHLGSQNLSKLQANQIQSMINNLTSTKSARVREYAFSVLRMSIRQAIREQLLKYDPTLAVSSPKKAKKELKPLSIDEWNGQGKPPKDVQYRLGHSSISMTLDTYTHHVPTRQNDIADWLETTIPSMVTS